MPKLKLQLGEDLRVARVAAPLTVALVQQQARALFGPQRYGLKYRDDDGDLVTVESEADLEAARPFLGATPKFVVAPPPPPRAPPTAVLVEAGAGAGAGWAPMAQPWRPGPAAGGRRRQRPGRAMVTFVTHEALADGARVAPLAALRKAWRVRNDGVAPWPAFCELHALDAPAQAPTPLPECGGLQPGAEAVVAVEIRAPALAGEYQMHFRVAGAAGLGRFGHRLRASFVVAPPPKAPLA